MHYYGFSLLDSPPPPVSHIMQRYYHSESLNLGVVSLTPGLLERSWQDF